MAGIAGMLGVAFTNHVVIMLLALDITGKTET